MRKIAGVFSVLFMLIFLGCQKEASFVGGPDPLPEIITPEPITATLQGNIFDETGAPAAGVTVQAGTKTATTNVTGYFRIIDAPLDKRASVVTATKAGYFKAFRTFGATSGSNQVAIKLIKKTLAGTVNATAGGEVSLTNGSKVSLPAGAVVTAATGAAYTGTVNVYAAYIDPTAQDIDQTIPGSFMATNKAGNRVTLVSQGMLAVELESASGEKLQIKTGSTATLTTAIPSATAASAPATIALWSIDEATGLWKEEGTATKTGNVYVGTVSHFSFWNCDIGIPAITLSMTLKDAAGVPVTHARVRISRTVNGWGTQGWTDSVGQVSGLVPKAETLVLDVLSQCGTPVYTQNIGPFAANTNLGVITITPLFGTSLNISGKLVNCNNAPVTNGYALITVSNYTRFVSTNSTGNFLTSFFYCSGTPGSATYSVVGTDITGQQQSAVVSGAAVAPLTDVGTISACGTSSAEFINYTVDGVAFALTSPTDSLNGAVSSAPGTGNTMVAGITGFRPTNNNFISYSWSQTANGANSYPLYAINVAGLDSITIINPFNVILTTPPPAVGGFFDGSFSGNVRDINNATHTLTATFRVKRMR